MDETHCRFIYAIEMCFHPIIFLLEQNYTQILPSRNEIVRAMCFVSDAREKSGIRADAWPDTCSLTKNDIHTQR
jgi:hypothetical protein